MDSIPAIGKNPQAASPPAREKRGIIGFSMIDEGCHGPTSHRRRRSEAFCCLPQKGGASLTAGGAFDRRLLPEHFDARVIHNKPTRFTRRHTQPQ